LIEFLRLQAQKRGQKGKEWEEKKRGARGKTRKEERKGKRVRPQ